MIIGRRRFVNMVSQKCMTGVCSVHRLNVSEHLFYPTTAEAEAAKPEISTLASLPAPTVSFESRPVLSRDQQIFALASPRSSEGRLLWSSPAENTLIYDLDSRSVHDMPSLSYKGSLRPITISIPRQTISIPRQHQQADEEEDAPLYEDLYVMSSITCSADFEVLRFNKSNLKGGSSTWQWHSLPPPPLSNRDSPTICSHAVLHDGRTICVTAFGADLRSRTDGVTYLFDTVKREWSQAPYGSDLPFSGGAHYVPGLNLWLGLARGSRRLSATDDLSAALDDKRPPILKHQWKDAMKEPEGWLLKKASLIDLGNGKFCIFKVIYDYNKLYKDTDDDDQYHLGRVLALLTGVEVKWRSSPHANAELRMVTHKSLSFVIKQDDDIIWVL